MPPRKKADVEVKEPTVVEETEELEDGVEPDEDDDLDGPDETGEDSDVEQPCVEHYPHGWKGVPAHHNGVGCEHGSWTRPES